MIAMCTSSPADELSTRPSLAMTSISRAIPRCCEWRNFGNNRIGLTKPTHLQKHSCALLLHTIRGIHNVSRPSPQFGSRIRQLCLRQVDQRALSSQSTDKNSFPQSDHDRWEQRSTQVLLFWLPLFTAVDEASNEAEESFRARKLACFIETRNSIHDDSVTTAEQKVFACLSSVVVSSRSGGGLPSTAHSHGPEIAQQFLSSGMCQHSGKILVCYLFTAPDDAVLMDTWSK